ncbi:hypothetical protein JAAARDRAFT_211087 [Jaapia argillacea MUCL 33604]|uniref:MYND-type domain-containing protein n=1 Tax=Jaapia argillacea MUCL 33604 TaxID=933084 RepID=A0A067P9B2_9AGAM|nr:hypothetical protein JAAARDRAFT_211087 [Jaapia argillacea MUCL 33604]
MSQRPRPPIQVYLPLTSLDECRVCNGKDNLRLCSGCAESVYCSRECQTNDWKEHKPTCKTHRIDIVSLYPVLASLQDHCRFHVDRKETLHPALKHKIVREDGNATLADGTIRHLITLGAPFAIGHIISNERLQEWHPTARSDSERLDLWHMLMRHSDPAPLVVATCIALLRSIYTTNTTGSAHPRTRLRYRSSPISDFGICAGSVELISMASFPLAIQLPNGNFVPRPSSKNHHWIYFTTVHKEELILDCNLFCMEYPHVVSMKGYDLPWKHPTTPGDEKAVPVHFVDRSRKRYLNTLPVYKPRRTISVLRDTTLQLAISQIIQPPLGPNVLVPQAILVFMDKVAGKGRRLTQEGRDLFQEWVLRIFRGLDEVTIQSNAWKRFPEDPNGLVLLTTYQDMIGVDSSPEAIEAFASLCAVNSLMIKSSDS